MSTRRALTFWQQVIDFHRVVIIRITYQDFLAHPDLVQKLLAQTLVMAVDTRYAYRDHLYTVAHPSLPSGAGGQLPMQYDLEIDLTGRLPSAWLGSDRLLKVEL